MTMQKYACFLMMSLGIVYAGAEEVVNNGPLRNKVLHNLDGIIINKDAIHDIILLYQLLTKMINELDGIIEEELQGLDSHQELRRLKKEFEDSTLQFIHIARAVKKWMIQLIDEWALLHNRQDTLLTFWTNMPNNSNEHEFIKEKITNTSMLRAFLTDLRSFLGDLVQSCPKGYNAFVKKYT